MTLDQLFVLMLPVIFVLIIVGVPYLFLFGGAERYLSGPLRRLSEGLDLHSTLEKGDVEVVYHTYRGLLIWCTQQEHRAYGSPEEVRLYLSRLLRFNLTWGLLSAGALIIPMLAVGNYYAQLRSIDKQAHRA